MNRQLLRKAGPPVGLFALFCSSGLLSIGMASARRSNSTPMPTIVAEVSGGDIDALHFAGVLSAEAVSRIAREVDGSSWRERSIAVVVLGAIDVATCEDLGRQLRELQRAYNPERPLVVLAREGERAVIRDFLTYERLGRAKLVTLHERAVFGDEHTTIPTPAAMIVRASGEIVAGVAHTFRSPNLRLHSFADQLGLKEGSRNEEE